jgi:hypothetical protein
VIEEIAKKQLHESTKVSKLLEAMGEMRRQMNQTKETLEWRIGPLEQAVLKLEETKDRVSQVESDAAGLQTTK